MFTAGPAARSAQRQPGGCSRARSRRRGRPGSGLTCTGLVTHGVRGLEGVEDVAGVVGEGVGGGVEVSADVDLDLEQRLQGPDDLADAVAGLVLEVAGDR